MNTIIAVVSVAGMLGSVIGKVYFSEHGSQELTREKATYMMFLDLLYRIESEHKYLTVRNLIYFFGQHVS